MATAIMMKPRYKGTEAGTARWAMARQFSLAFISIFIAAGCTDSSPRQDTFGPIPPSDRAADLRDDRIRLLGEDRAPAVSLDEPVYKIPLLTLDAGFDFFIVDPTVHVYDYFVGDTPDVAARQMFDESSADNRRRGIYRLAEEEYARQGTAERDEWAHKASYDSDYTVRAAGIRVLNRCRDAGKTQLYLDGLKEEKPLVRLEAAKALANVPDPQAVEPLLDHLQNDLSHDVRIASADALRCYKTDQVANALISVLNDTDFGVAWQARQSLRLMTAHDYHYDEAAWLNYLSGSSKPFE
jgi:hypothetical protein